MVVTDDIPGLEVTVTVNDEALKEYHETGLDEGERMTTRYIEAVSGQQFAIKMRVDDSFLFKGNCISFHVYVDGQRAHAPFIKKITRTHGRISEGQNTNHGTKVKRYRFASLETVNDGHAKLGETSRVKDFGTIRIECSHRNFRGRAKTDSRREVESLGIVSEEVLKGHALSHSIDFMEAVPRKQAAKTRSTMMVRGETNPAATFVFHYRSSDALKSMLIIPRTPSPPPPTPLEERDVSTLSREEMVELQKLVREGKMREESNLKIKRERHEDGNPRPRKIARPRAGDTQLEIDEGGNFREDAESTLDPAGTEVIEID